MNHLKTYRLNKKILVVVLVATMVVPALASAQTSSSYTPLSPLPCVPSGSDSGCEGGNKGYGVGEPMTSVDFNGYLQYIFNLVIALAASSAVFMIVWGGFQYMTTDSWEGKSEGLDKARNAVYGLLLVLASYLILKTIDPRLVAIPTSLVPNISKNLTVSNTLSSLLGQIQSDATTYNVNISDLTDSAKTAGSDATVASQDISSIDQQIAAAQGLKNASMSDEDIDSLCTTLNLSQAVGDLCDKRAIAMNKLSSSNETVAYDVALGKLSTQISAINNQIAACKGDADCVNALMPQRDALVTLTSQSLSQVSPAQEHQLLAYRDYTSALFNAQAALATEKAHSTVDNLSNLKTSLGILYAAVDNYAKNPNADPSIVKLMAPQKQNIVNALQTAGIKYP